MSKERLQLPEYTKAIRRLMPELVAILEKDIQEQAYGFAFYEEKKERNIFAGKIESGTSTVDRGMVLRLLYNGKNFESATNNLEPENLKKMAAELNKSVKSLPPDPDAPVYKPKSWDSELQNPLPEELSSQIPRGAANTTEIHFGVPVEMNPFEIPVGKLIATARGTRDRITEEDAIYSRKNNLEPLALAYVTYRLRLFNHIFVDREKNMSQSLPVCIGIFLGQTQKGRYGRSINGGLSGFEIIQYSDEAFYEAVEVPHKLDEAEFLKPGTYPVITGPDITGVFAHEAFGHTQEGDTCRQGRSITAQLNGEQVGNEMATIINNAAVFSMESKDYGTNGSYFFDHEGELARENVILDKGKLSEPMTDLLTSLHLGIRRTASGKRESWRRPTLTRQTNTYFSPGDKTLEELIAMVDGTGYLAVASHGGMEDPKGANLTAGAEYFQEIVNGKLTGKYLIGPKGGHIELSGYVPDLLKGIKGKCKVDYNSKEPDKNRTPENKIGGCGKFHKELVMAGCGGPFILWSDVTCG